MLNINYYKDRVCLNVLAGSLDNAKEVYAASEGHVVVGVLSKNYESVDSAVEDMKRYQRECNNGISVGLGAGDPNQWKMVAEISEKIGPQHINQVFTGVGYSRAKVGQEETVINCLISPTGKPGFVKISTGPLSSQGEDGVVPVDTAISMIKDMGGSSVKYFPMKGLEHIEEYREVARACADAEFILEPTGGIDLGNYREILEIAIDAGVKKVIPHIYSSIIDKESGDTRPTDVKRLLEITREVVG